LDILDYAESKADNTLDYLRGSYDDLHERTHKTVTALVGGAGAVGSYALSKIGNPADRVLWSTLAALSVTWFVIAVVVALKGARTRELSPGNGPENITRYFHERLLSHPLELTDREYRALVTTREAELVRQQIRIKEYINGCTARARTLDGAYAAIALSPVAPLLVLGVALTGQ
jgi:hypothetical protein